MSLRKVIYSMMTGGKTLHHGQIPELAKHTSSFYIKKPTVCTPSQTPELKITPLNLLELPN